MTIITIPQGTDSGRRWLVNDGATGLPCSLEGWTVRSQIRKLASSPDVLHEFSTTLGNATAGSDGFVTLLWSAAETSAWQWAEAVFDIELTNPDGKVMRLDSGRVAVSREVTRDA